MTRTHCWFCIRQQQPKHRSDRHPRRIPKTTTPSLHDEECIVAEATDKPHKLQKATAEQQESTEEKGSRHPSSGKGDALQKNDTTEQPNEQSKKSSSVVVFHEKERKKAPQMKEQTESVSDDSITNDDEEEPEENQLCVEPIHRKIDEPDTSDVDSDRMPS